MTADSKPHSRKKNPSDDGKKTRRSAPRRLAEGISLAISALLILSLAGYLLWEAVEGNGPYAVVDVQLAWADLQETNGTYILPVRIKNTGSVTLRDLEVRINHLDEDGKSAEREIKIDYIGEQSTETIYLYFNRPPKELQVKAIPLQYRAQ